MNRPRLASPRLAWIIGGRGVVASAIGAIVQPEAFASAWLAAFTTWLRWPLGCLAILLVHALTGRRSCRASVSCRCCCRQ